MGNLGATYRVFRHAANVACHANFFRFTATQADTRMRNISQLRQNIVQGLTCARASLCRCDRRPPYHAYALLMTGKTPDAISVLIGGEEEEIEIGRYSEVIPTLYD